jgi:hypothetical protein
MLVKKSSLIDQNTDNIIGKLFCGLIIGILYCMSFDSEMKSMLMILFLLSFSAFWGIINQKKIWLTVLLIWGLIPIINLYRIFVLQEQFDGLKGLYSLALFSFLSLLLCFLGVYSSIFARSIARRAGI